MRKTATVSLIIIGIILTGLLLLLGGFSCWIGGMITDVSTFLVTSEQTMEGYQKYWNEQKFDADAFFSQYQIEHVVLNSSLDEHRLPLDIISAAGNRNLVIMVHGLGGNRLSNYPLSEFFLQNGYNVITYDQRSSGENNAERSTYGYLEKYDLIDCIDYAAENYSEAEIVVWGESMGGSTAVQAIAYEDMQKNVAALILDCPLSSMTSIIEGEIKSLNHSLPFDYLMFCGNLMNKIKLGFTYKEGDAFRYAGDITIPTLIFNSRADEMTPAFMGEDIYINLSAEKKELYTSDTAWHTGIRQVHPEDYYSRILEYLP